MMQRFRLFIQQSWNSIPVLTLLLLFTVNLSAKPDTKKIMFPRAFAIAIDDMGWNEGGSLAATNGGWRVGVRRDFDVRDYRPIVEVGKAVGVRFQGLFVLAEMDRLNVCAKYPTITQDGENWDNDCNIDPTQIETMNYIKDNAAFLEFGLHGVGHEHWIDGKRTRAEWYDLENNKPWPEDDMLDHLKCFKEIMAQYGWTPENGQSFPESFVPPCYSFYWNPESNYSTGKLMLEAGVKYANTQFDYVTELNPPMEFGGGWDHGILVINRLQYGNNWFETAKLPTESVEKYETDIIETHWANWMATDDFLQPALNQKWIEFFKNIQTHPDHYLSKNTEQLFSQWLYKRFTKITEEIAGEVTIDNTKLPDEAYNNDFLGNMVLAVKLAEGEHVSDASLDGQPIAAYFEDAGYGFLYLPPLEKKEYQFKYKIGKRLMKNFVNNDGTYNVYTMQVDKKNLVFDIEMYGTQIVKIKCRKPASVTTSNPNLKILSEEYDTDKKMLFLKLYGLDMQGESGKIIIKF